MIAHPIALVGGVAFIPFTYVIVVSPMAQFFPRSLLRWIEREWIRNRGVEFGSHDVPAIGDSLQRFEEKGAGDRHQRTVTYIRDVCNWASAACPLPNAASDASVAMHAAIGFSRVGIYGEVGRKFGRWLDVGWWQRLL